MSGPPRSAPPPPPPEEEEGADQGASAHERLLAAAKTDNEDLLEASLNDLNDINYVDGLGNTALHYAIQNASTSVLEPILCHESCDVDIRNRLAGDTPLHIAVRQRWEEHPGLRVYLVESLLEAGADTFIKNRHNQRPIDILPPSGNEDDERVRAALRKAEAESSLAVGGDVVDEDAEDEEIDSDDIASD